MKVLLFPFFILRLSLVVLPSLVLLTTAVFKWYSLVVSLGVFIGASLLAFQTVILNPRKMVAPSFGTPVPPQKNLHTATYEIDSAPNTVKTEITKWQELSKMQPLHRDILVNLSILHEAQKNDSLAKSEWAKAESLDPNAPLFSTPAR